MTQSSRSLTRTYGGRRNRQAKTPRAQDDASHPTSPLRSLDETEYVPVPEGIRRMRKRSRTLSRKSSALDLDSQGPVQKNSEDLRHNQRKSLATKAFPLNKQDINDLSYQTPRPLESPVKPKNAEQDALEQLSPVPIARRMLSRMSSRNLKENRSNRNLASPFSSRPGSRSGSPEKPIQDNSKRPRLHVKSRTLSSSIMSNVKNPNPSLRKSANAFNNNFSDESVATTSTTQQIAHARTTSIPTIPSNPLGQISPQAWLVPPKAISRSPIALSVPPDVNEHASFYFDTPIEVSTPARDKKGFPDAQKTRQPSIYSDDSDFDMSDAPESPTKNPRTVLRALIPPASPRKPGRRRRTIMHVSSDSIFSDALDFSTYITDDESPGHIRRTTERGSYAQPSSPTVSRLRSNTTSGIGLDAAFCPLSASGKRPIRAPNYDSSDDDEVCERIMSLDLNDSLAKGPIRIIEDAEDVVHPMESVSSIQPSKRTTRQNRKRGDTIRASDYPQPPIVLLPARAADAIHSEAPATRTKATAGRRTRSGTVTQANSNASAKGSASLDSATGNIRTTTVNQAGPSKPGRSRQETQKTKRRTQILTKPVPFESPPPPDDEDDELLLTDEIQDF